MAGDGLKSPSAEELAILAHEVRSPVAALAALADAGPTADPESLVQLLVLARAAVADVVRLCEEVDGVRLGPLERVPLESVMAAATAPGVTVELEEGLIVAGDATRLRQAVGNIVANGVRHASTVRVTGRRSGTGVLIEIDDDGPGVPAGVDVFAKGVSGAGSSGYGLWLARSIVEAHGGTLELVRSDGPGACFRIVLPLAPASA